MDSPTGATKANESPPRLALVPEKIDLKARRAAEALADRQLVEQTLRGDDEAFATLVARYGQPIISLCYASTLDRADAEDLAQEIFLTAWRKLATFRGDAAFSTWLFALARNACVDRSRRQSARPQRTVSDLVPEQVAEESADPAAVGAVFAVAATLPEPLRPAPLVRAVPWLSHEELVLLHGV